MNPKPKPEKFIKSIVFYIIVVSAFIGVFGLYTIPKVNAANPTITFETHNICTGVGCATGFNAFGTINQFNPSTVIGDGLIAVFYCVTGGTFNNNPSVIVNSITDTIGNNWTTIGTFVTGANNFIDSNAQFQYTASVWITNIRTNAVGSFTMIVNFSPYATGCYDELYLASTPISINTFQFANVKFFPGSGLFQLSSFTQPVSTVPVTAPGNSYSFEINWNIPCGAGDVSVTQNNNFLTLLNSVNQINNPSPVINVNTYFSWNPNKFTTPYSVINTVNPTCSQHYFFGIVVMIFTPQTTSTGGLGSNGNTCTGSSCGIVGGGTTLDQSTQFTINANTTYYYYGTTIKGGAIITNVTTKIASYTNGNPGKGTDTYELAVYSMPAGLNITGSSPSGTPFKRIFNVNRTITTGSTNVWGHGGSLDLSVPANTTYAVSITSKFSGLTIYHALTTSVSMLNSTEGTFSGATWSPPFTLSKTNLNLKLGVIDNLFLEWFGYNNPTTIIQTITSTTLTTCIAGSTCTLTTITTFITKTSVQTTLAGAGGGIAMIQNLINYWPLWMIPLFFIPFGIQGLLLGFIFGVVIGGIEGIIPLWAAFMLGLVTIYLLSKRF